MPGGRIDEARMVSSAGTTQDGSGKHPPIASKERGPGPARYALPSTIGFIGNDFTKPTSPAYSLHNRMSSNLYFVDSSPGPQYHIDAKTTRFGMTGSPAYSIQSRTKRSPEPFQTPGPGAYSPEMAPPQNHQCRPPSYSMGARTRYRPMDTVPAPNRYTLPALLGSTPPNKPASARHSISARRGTGGASEDLSQTPGPARYNTTDPSTYMCRQPAFSMLGRHKRPNNTTQKPGPGAYSPERVVLHKPRPPSYTLGIRHSEYVMPLVLAVPD